uniref:Uncharacterized protein n=1 Tax=Cacopsylla melanoneura TaxID=428564 RepID=A0A8D9AAY8_9HEMI
MPTIQLQFLVELVGHIFFQMLILLHRYLLKDGKFYSYSDRTLPEQIVWHSTDETCSIIFSIPVYKSCLISANLNVTRNQSIAAAGPSCNSYFLGLISLSVFYQFQQKYQNNFYLFCNILETISEVDTSVYRYHRRRDL